MTREEIENMPAGVEIDELITVHVMGEEIPPRGYAVTPYSTDSSAALTIVEKMKEKTPCFWFDEGRWTFQYCHPYAIAEAETFALAICRAALLASPLTGE